MYHLYEKRNRRAARPNVPEIYSAVEANAALKSIFQRAVLQFAKIEILHVLEQ
jgi:hypothetical protein